MTDAAVELVRFVTNTRWSDLPPQAQAMTRLDLLDTIATMLGGQKAPGVELVTAQVLEWGGRPESRVYGYPVRVPAPEAALANGMAAHALDYDDTHDQAVLHAGVSVIPAAMAVAERQGGVTGEELLVAVAVGLEVVCRLGMGCGHGPGSGWILSSLYGYFGAAAAAGRLLGLTPAQQLHAFGIAYAQVAGNNQSVHDGALTKRMQPALAARGGVLGAMLAARGLTGAQEVLEGPSGLYRLYHRGDYSRERLLDGLGERWELSALSLKPYPSCRFTHSAIDGALLLRERGMAEADRVVVEVNSQAYKACAEPRERKLRPQNVVDAQFSIPFTVATALRTGGFSVDALRPEALRDPATLAAAGKVEVQVGEAIEREAGRGITPARLIAWQAGERAEVFIDFPLGHPKRPMSREAVTAKVEGCAAEAVRPLDGAAVSRLLAAVDGLASAGSVAPLFDAIEGGVSDGSKAFW